MVKIGDIFSKAQVKKNFDLNEMKNFAKYYLPHLPFFILQCIKHGSDFRSQTNTKSFLETS